MLFGKLRPYLAKVTGADWHFIGNMALPLPPLAEQTAIAEYPDKTVASIDARARRQAELMEEYRARLIADVVTGKLDVREAAEKGGPTADNGNMDGETIEGKVTA